MTGKDGEDPGDAITSVEHPASERSIPPAALEAQGVLKDAPKTQYEYNPHLPGPGIGDKSKGSRQSAGSIGNCPTSGTFGGEAKALAEAVRRLARMSSADLFADPQHDHAKAVQFYQWDS